MRRIKSARIIFFSCFLLISSLAPSLQSAPAKIQKKPAPPKSSAKTYRIVPAESSLTVFVAKAGIASFVAHDHNIAVRTYSGQVTIPNAGPGEGSLELDIDARSLSLTDKISEKDRNEITASMNNIVLESGKFPKITFRSTGITNFNATGNGANLTVNGDLTLHGTTKRIAIPVTVAVSPQQLRATGKYVLRQTDFGITPYSAFGGTVKVKNEVVINFNIVAK